MLVRLLLIFISLITVYLWANINKYKLHWKIGGPIGLPFLGNILQFLRLESILKQFGEFEKAYKSPFCCWFGPICIVMVSDPDTVQTILTSENCTTKTFFYKFLSQFIGDGLFTSDPPKWNNRVKFMKPAFKNKILGSFYPEFNKQGDYLLQTFSDNIKNENFSIFQNLKILTINTTLQTVIGDYTKQKLNEVDKVLESIESVMHAMINRTYSPWLYMDFIYENTRIYKNTKRLLTNIIQIFDQKMAIKREEIYNKKEVFKKTLSDDDNHATLKAPSSFFEYIITYGDDYNLSNAEALEEALVVLAASYETTAVGVYLVLICLATHPDIQDKLYAELLTHLPDKDIELDHNLLKNLVYLQMCIDETIRVISPVPLVGRHVTQDIELKNGYVLPKGTDVVLDIFNMQRSTKYWGPNAKSFNPENFLPGKKYHPYSYIPFTKGQRMCLGFKYANILMKIFLAKIFRNYRITSDIKFEDLTFLHNISIKIQNHPKFQIELREQ